MTDPKPVESWLTDMDGGLVREERALPGGSDSIAALRQLGRPFLVLTNNSIYTASDLRARLLLSGIDVPEGGIWTDVRTGTEAGMRTILVPTGSTKAEDVERFPYRPTRVANSIAEVVELVSELAPTAAVA